MCILGALIMQKYMEMHWKFDGKLLAPAKHIIKQAHKLKKIRNSQLLLLHTSAIQLKLRSPQTMLHANCTA
jgi:hypothetical protein